MNANRQTRKWAGHFAVVLAVTLIAGCLSAGDNASATTLNSRATAPGQPCLLTPHPITVRVSPTLYGQLTGEINYSYEDGLYGESGSGVPQSGFWLTLGSPCTVRSR